MQTSKIFTLTLIMITAHWLSPVFGQSSGTNVFGEVLEASTEEAMEFVNVKLIETSEEELVMGAITDKEGIFRFSNVQPGDYFLEVSFIGFETKTTEPFTVKNGEEEIDLDEITIEISPEILEDVEVTAEKSTLNLAIDRKVYNVEKDIMSTTSSATEILQNLPSVTVDVNGQISLRGSSNITFFINGRPSALLRSNSTVALQSMPANTIERIEVITNPSAKYKPDGIGGIINIVLKEESNEGLNGTVMANVGNLERYNGNITLNYGMDNMNFYTSYGFRHSNTPRNDVQSIINKDGNGGTISTFDKKIDSKFDKYSHIVNAGWEYEINDNNVLEISGNYYFGIDDKKTFTDAVFSHLLEPAENETFTTDRTLDEEEQEYEIGLAFEHSFDEDHTLTFEYNYADFLEKETNLFDQHFIVPSTFNQLSSLANKISGPTQEIVLEYAVPIGEETEFEAGYTGEFLQEEINFRGETFDKQGNTWLIDPTKTSKFIFTQNIHAFYATLGHSIGNYSFLAGLRAEQALVTSDLESSEEKIPNDYFRLYPTLHIGYEVDDNQEFQLSYSKRVNRADSDEQNPFPEYSDPNNREVGNPKLKPEQIHSLELGYRLQGEKFTFLPSLYYRYKQDGFTEITKIVDNNISETTFTNLENDQSAGFEFIFTHNPFDRLSWDFSANLFYQQIDARNLGLSKYKSSVSWDAKLGININITKSTLGQINSYYRSSRITPQGEFNSIFLLNFGLRQDILKKKASIVLTVSDAFSTLNYESFIDTPTLYQNTKYGRNTQIVYLGFVYHFGKSIQKKQSSLDFEDKIEAGKKVTEEK